MPTALRAAALFAMITIAFATAAPAQQQRLSPSNVPIVEGLKVPLGSDEATIRAAYDITAALAVVVPGRSSLGRPDKDAPPEVMGLRSPKDGIWFFFNRSSLNHNIRLEAPFAGHVRGIRVGDSKAQLIAALGAPLKAPWKFGPDMAHIYDLSDIAQIRYDISPDQKVVRMFVLLRKLVM